MNEKGSKETSSLKEIMELSSKAWCMALANGAVSLGLPGCLDLGVTLIAWIFGVFFEFLHLRE